MLEDIKLLLGLTDDSEDELLELLIKMATNEVKDYTGQTTITSGLKNTISKMVIFNYNRLGTEGLSSESYSGVTFNYAGDYPDSIMRELETAKRAGISSFKFVW